MFAILLTLGRVLDTVSVSANQLIQNETAGCKHPVAVVKKNEPSRLEIQKQRSTFRSFKSSMFYCTSQEGLGPGMT